MEIRLFNYNGIIDIYAMNSKWCDRFNFSVWFILIAFAGNKVLMMKIYFIKKNTLMSKNLGKTEARVYKISEISDLNQIMKDSVN